MNTLITGVAKFRRQHRTRYPTHFAMQFNPAVKAETSEPGKPGSARSYCLARATETGNVRPRREAASVH